MNPKERLDQIYAEIRALEDEKEQIMLASIEAPEAEKVCADFIAQSLVNLRGPKGFPSLEFPVEVRGFVTEGCMVHGGREAGSWVAIRPCGKEYEGKTYLGLALGDIATTFGIYFNKEDGVLGVLPSFGNPAIFVFALKKIVFGFESWWGVLKKPEDLKAISNQDIDSIWYVQALKSLSGKSPKQVASVDEQCIQCIGRGTIECRGGDGSSQG